MAFTAGRRCYADINQTNRFLFGTAGWTGDPGSADTDIGVGDASDAGSHFFCYLWADSAMAKKGRFGYAKDILFDLITVGHNSAPEAVACSGDRCDF